jgi:prepilin-type processing-associated H-X9-DG protein
MIEVGDLQLPRSVFSNVITPEHKSPIGRLNSVVPKRHAGGANMVFADGHVESATQARWIVENAPARLRWNNDHGPHPETW